MRFLIVLLSFITCNSVFAQDYAFKVLINKGNNEIKSGNAWQPVKTGTILRPEDELKVSENSYIGLVHATGKPMELRQGGNYKIADLASQVKESSGVLNKYVDFILKNSDQAVNKLNVTGAAHRGEGFAIHLFLPQTVNIYSNTAIIRWEGESLNGPYLVTIKNMFDDILATVETPENLLKLDLTLASVAPENEFLIQVASKTQPEKISNQHLIKRLPPVEREKVKENLASIKIANDTQSALEKVILAGYYEQNDLQMDALTCFEEALNFAPDVIAYKETYEAFLVRNGLKK